MGPTLVYSCMKDRLRSMVENMSRSRTTRDVQRRNVGGRKNGMWMVDIKDSSNQMAEKDPRVQVSHPVRI